MKSFIVCLFVAACFLIVPTPSAQAAGGRLLTLPLRAPVMLARGINNVRKKSIENRACRGNRLAAARAQAICSRHNG